MKNKFLFFLVFILAWPSFSFAIQTNQYNGTLNNSLGSIIETKRKAQPSAANDPTGAISFGVINSALNSLIPCAPTLVGTWVSYFYCVGASVAVGTAISLGINSAITLTKGEGQTVQASGSGMPVGVSTSFPTIPSSSATLALYPPGEYWFSNTTGTGARHITVKTVLCASNSGVTQWCSGMNAQSASYLTYDFSAVSAVNATASVWYKSYTMTIISSELIGYDGATPIYQRTFSIVLEETAATGKTVTFPAYVPFYGTPAQIMADVPTAQATVPLSDAMLAQLANSILEAVNVQLAATPNATPIPPITVQDVAGWRATHPTLIPTGQDFNTPVALPGSETIHIPNPNLESALPAAPGTTPQAVTIQGIDWGAFSSPQVDTTAPTTASILDPILTCGPRGQILLSLRTLQRVRRLCSRFPWSPHSGLIGHLPKCAYGWSRYGLRCKLFSVSCGRFLLF